MNPSKVPTEIPPFSDERDAIIFRTQVTWTAYNLGSALTSLDSIYSTFLLVRHLAIEANRRFQRAAEQLDRYWMILEQEGPHLDMLAHEWRHLLRRYGPGAASLVFPFGPFTGAASEQLAASFAESEIEYCLRHPSEYMQSSQELRVKKMEIASPGGFTLEGLGEPLRELRELIKDLCYRNRQEREKGDLEILKQKIEIIGHGTLSTQQVHVLAMSSVADVKEVGQLLNESDLMLEGEHCQTASKPDFAKKPRRRRRASTEQ